MTKTKRVITVAGTMVATAAIGFTVLIWQDNARQATQNAVDSAAADLQEAKAHEQVQAYDAALARVRAGLPIPKTITEYKQPDGITVYCTDDNCSTDKNKL